MKKKFQEKDHTRLDYFVFVVTLFTLFASIADVFIDARTMLRNEQSQEAQERESELKSHPHFVGTMEKRISIGPRNYYEIRVKNVNSDIKLTNGTFGFEYVMLIEKPKDDTFVVVVCEDMVAQESNLYNSALGGCFVLIEEDYFACEKKLKGLCAAIYNQEMLVHSYIFFCFHYIYEGVSKEVYYLLELPESESQEALEPERPEDYMSGVRMCLREGTVI